MSKNYGFYEISPHTDTLQVCTDPLDYRGDMFIASYVYGKENTLKQFKKKLKEFYDEIITDQITLDDVKLKYKCRVNIDYGEAYGLEETAGEDSNYLACWVIDCDDILDKYGDF